MGYANLEGTYWSDVSLAANLNGDAIDVRCCGSGALALVWTGASATDAVVKLQESMDQATWFDIATQTKTVGAAAGTNLFKLTKDVMKCPYIRAVLTKNTETTGTATIKFLFKGDR